ncbi:MAG TPA: hypothetical protein PKL24_15865 [Polyangiaceae bacterium]|nr:hypothetical protein [Polyangiaceae bacterium]HOD22462.1 hypothetical protein [Polyangiaceae bacterium]HOH01392.1 hypothetical protein [Polyangiaceae bacterium]HPK94528.1 hypothetical protein [Polyangiaceae bacterium]HQM09331.1 hypothetical protein [Polyangiaceae bacterium]
MKAPAVLSSALALSQGRSSGSQCRMNANVRFLVVLADLET